MSAPSGLEYAHGSGKSAYRLTPHADRHRLGEQIFRESGAAGRPDAQPHFRGDRRDAARSVAQHDLHRHGKQYGRRSDRNRDLGNVSNLPRL